MLHARDWARAGHARPPCAGATATERVLSWTPPPHDAEHGSQAPHADTSQSTGHACALHVRFWCRKPSKSTPPPPPPPGNAGSPQTSPPYRARPTTDRDRFCIPPPHVREHNAHADHAEVGQLAAQRSVTHARQPRSRSPVPNGYGYGFRYPEPTATALLAPVVLPLPLPLELVLAFTLE